MTATSLTESSRRFTDISPLVADGNAVSDRTWPVAAIVGVPSATVAVAAGVAALAVVLVIAVVRVRSRRRYMGGIKLDSPTAILEEMRKRLEDLPALPEFATQHEEELALENPFAEPDSPPNAIVAQPPVDSPPELPSRRSPPPLPTDADDPVTGEPDEEAYRAWLREWLIYAEQYGDTAPNDPAIQ